MEKRNHNNVALLNIKQTFEQSKKKLFLNKNETIESVSIDVSIIPYINFCGMFLKAFMRAYFSQYDKILMVVAALKGDLGTFFSFKVFESASNLRGAKKQEKFCFISVQFSKTEDMKFKPYCSSVIFL